MSVHLLPYGDRAWLVDEVADPIALAPSLRAFVQPTPIEVVVGARTCLLRFGVPKPDRSVVEAAVRAGEDARELAEAPRTEIIPVTYDGADLAEVAARAGLPVEEVVRLHSSARYRAAFLGFVPGFAYLSGLPPALQLPRRATPRLRVPAGSVAVAHEYTAVYPRESPGGWRLLGRTSERLFDLDRDPPCRLSPGTLVHFEAVP